MIKFIKQILKFWFSFPRPLRFLLVGGFNTAFSFCVFTMLIFCGLKYNITLVISYIIGVNCSIVTMKYFVYQSEASFYQCYAKGWITYLSTFALNYAFLYVLIELMGINPVVSQAVYTAFSTVYIYLMHKYFTYGNVKK